MSYEVYATIHPARTVTLPSQTEVTLVLPEGTAAVAIEPDQPLELPEYRLIQLLPVDGSMDDEGLAALLSAVADVPGLGLNLSAAPGITGAGLRHVHLAPKLGWLHLLEREDLTDEDLAHLRGHTGILELHLGSCPQITRAGLEHVVTLRELRGLDLSWCRGLSPEDPALLTQLARLRWLDLTRCDIDDSTLASLASLRGLRRLGLSGTAISPAALAHLAHLAHLRQLFLPDSAPLDRAALRVIGALGTLRELGLTIEPPAPLSALQELDGLESLSLVLRGELGEPGLTALGHKPLLRELVLEGGISDRDLEWIAAQPSLAHLTLISCDQITDAGIAALADLAQPEWVTFWRCAGVTEAATEALAARLPDATIDRA